MFRPSYPPCADRNRPPHRAAAPVLALLAIAIAACGDDGGTEPNGRVVAGVDLDVLFAPATASEIDAVLADWAGRSPIASGYQVESVDTSAAAGVDLEIRVVSHTVDGNRHYGAFVVPFGPNADPGPLPIVGYLHGGDDGFSVSDVTLVAGQASSLAGSVVWVAPSFRSEELRYAGGALTSEGDASPWDRDVDDALALLAVAAAEVPEADASRVALLGLSRGAGVALLMAERDPSIDMVVEFFGPTDFFGAFVQEVVADALRGTVRDLPGLEVLNAEFIVPLREGATTIQAVRAELVRRSTVLFADRLPDLQVHHGELDPVVAVSQAESLIDTMLGLGRGATPLCPPIDGPSGGDDPLFEACLYPSGSHNPFTMAGSIPRTETFLERILAP